MGLHEGDGAGRSRGLGGAAQAAADLAAAGRSADPARTAAAREVFRAVSKVTTGTRTFARGHPTLVGFLDEFTARIDAYLAQHGDLVVAVQAQAGFVDGEEVYAAARVEDSFLFPFYQAGVRQLTFLPGLERAESEELFAIADRAARAGGGGEDDAVTLLWSAGLPHVGHVVVETFTESAGGEENEWQEAAAANLQGLIHFALLKQVGATRAGVTTATTPGDRLRRLHTVRLSGADETLLRSEDLATLDEMAASTAAPVDEPAELARHEDEALAAIGAELVRDPHAGARVRAALVAAVAGALDEDATSVAAHAAETLATLLEEEALACAADLAGCLARAASGASAATRAALDEALAGPRIREAVVAPLLARPDPPPELPALLVALPPRVAVHALERFQGVLSRDGRKGLCDAVAAMGERAVDVVLGALGATDEATASSLLQIVRAVGGARALEALDTAAAHPAASVRFEAIHAYLQTAPAALAFDRARALLHDPDAAIRRIAVTHLTTARGPRATALLRELIDDPAFEHADLAEKKRIFLAFAQTGGRAAAPILRERLARRALLGRAEVEETRAAVACALGFLRDEESRPLLEKHAGSVLGRAVVRHACQEALAVLDAPLAAPRGPRPLAREDPFAAADPDDDAPVAPAPATGAPRVLDHLTGEQPEVAIAWRSDVRPVSGPPPAGPPGSERGDVAGTARAPAPAGVNPRIGLAPTQPMPAVAGPAPAPAPARPQAAPAETGSDPGLDALLRAYLEGGDG